MFSKKDLKIAQSWAQDRLREQNGYAPKLNDIQILSMGGFYDSVHVFHPVKVSFRVSYMRYDFFESRLLEKVDCSEPAEVGFEEFLNYVDGEA